MKTRKNKIKTNNNNNSDNNDSYNSSSCNSNNSSSTSSRASSSSSSSNNNNNSEMKSPVSLRKKIMQRLKKKGESNNNDVKENKSNNNTTGDGKTGKNTKNTSNTERDIKTGINNNQREDKVEKECNNNSNNKGETEGVIENNKVDNNMGNKTTDNNQHIAETNLTNTIITTTTAAAAAINNNTLNNNTLNNNTLDNNTLNHSINIQENKNNNNIGNNEEGSDGIFVAAGVCGRLRLVGPSVYYYVEECLGGVRTGGDGRNNGGVEVPLPLTKFNSVPPTIEFTENDALEYAKNFVHKEHQNFIGEDDSQCVVAVSVVKSSKSTEQDQFQALVRTEQFSLRNLVKADNPKVKENLIILEKSQYIKQYKVGVLYCADSQTTENAMFSNESGSERWDEFLEFLGNKIELKGWKGFAGGLDVKHNSTGTHSIFNEWRNYQMMFHISTMLPYAKDDPQQLERKRHVGNDVVLIVFKESSAHFDPMSIASHFMHVVIVIEPFIFDGVTYYRMEVASKSGVPYFGPKIIQPLFKKDIYFHDFLAAKIINGERASYHAPEFRPKITRTRSQILHNCAEVVKPHCYTMKETSSHKNPGTPKLRRLTSVSSTAIRNIDPASPFRNTTTPLVERPPCSPSNNPRLSSLQKKNNRLSLSFLRKKEKT